MYANALALTTGAGAVNGKTVTLPPTDIPSCFGAFFSVTLGDPGDTITVKLQVNSGLDGIWYDVPGAAATLTVTASQFAVVAVPGKAPKFRFVFTAVGIGPTDTISVTLSGLPTGTGIA